MGHNRLNHVNMLQKHTCNLSTKKIFTRKLENNNLKCNSNRNKIVATIIITYYLKREHFFTFSFYLWLLFLRTKFKALLTISRKTLKGNLKQTCFNLVNGRNEREFSFLFNMINLLKLLHGFWLLNL